MSIELLNSYQIERPTFLQSAFRATCIWLLWFVFMIVSVVIFLTIAIALGVIISVGFCSYLARSTSRWWRS